MSYRFGLCIFVFSMWASLPTVVVAESAAQQLAGLRTIYESGMAKIEKEYRKSVDQWPAGYRRSLATLQTSRQKAGDLDGWQTAKDELARFDADGTIPDERSTVVGIRVLQDTFATVGSSARSQRAVRTSNLSTQYTARLTATKIALTKADRLEDAISVNNEIQRVNELPAVAAAKFELALATVDTVEADVVEADVPSVDPIATAGMEGFEKDGFTVYDAGRRPAAVSGAVYKSVTLRATKAIGARKRVSCTLMVRSSSGDSAKQSASHGHSSNTVRANETHTFARLSLRSSTSSKVLEEAQVVVQYFAVPANKSSSRDIDVALDCRLEMPRLDGTARVVDCPALELGDLERTHLGRSSGFNQVQRGQKYYGIAVSVFQNDGTLAYQGISHSSLEDHVVRGPEDAPSQKAGDLRERLEEAEEEVRGIYGELREDPKNKELREEMFAAKATVNELRRALHKEGPAEERGQANDFGEDRKRREGDRGRPRRDR